MAHIDGVRKDSGRFKQENEWLPVAAQVGELANEYAGRRDLAATVAAGVGHGAPACFIPATAEVEIDREVVLPGVNPLAVDLTTEEGRLGHPSLVGAVMHEAAHARHSLWEQPKRDAVPKRVRDVMTVLEESRIEARLVRRHGDRVKRYLRACALEIVAKDFRVADTRYGASIGAALTLARVSSGVLQEDDVAEIRAAIEEALGADTVEQLQEVWETFHRIRTAVAYPDPTPGWESPQVQQMITLAQRWLEIIGVEENDPADDLAAVAVVLVGDGEGEPDDEGGEGDAGVGDGEGEGKGADGAMGGGADKDGDDGDEKQGAGKAPTLADMIKDAAVIVAIEADTDAAIEKRRERDARIVKERRPDNRRDITHREQAAKVFSGTHAYGGHAEDSYLSSKREPTSDERRAAVALGRALERVQYQDRAVIKRATVVPGGRLRSRGAVQREAERSRGAIMTAAPWVQKKRTHTDEVPLTIGFMSDVSGSMGAAMAPMGSIGWVLPEATRRVTGKIASVLFGSTVYGVIKPGQHRPEVHVWSAHDGTEEFKRGFQAIDGELQLLTGTGARLLVIASDGQFVTTKDEVYADEMMQMCRSRGVAVIWLDFSSRRSGRQYVNNHGYGAIVQVGGLPPVEVAEIVGKAAVEALAFASKAVQA